MDNGDLIAEDEFDIKNNPNKMSLRFYKPTWNEEDRHWTCRFEISDPINESRAIYGKTSLQALILAFKTASGDLYGSDLYKKGELGIEGEFGGYLYVPATKHYLDIAPYPF